MAADRLLAVALLFVFLIAMDRLTGKAQKNAAKIGGITVVVGVIVARFAFVIVHLDSFTHEWWTVLAFWQGGFIAWPGILASAAIIAYRMRPLPVMARAQAALGILAAAWFLGSAIIRPDPKPLPILPALVTLDGRPFQQTDLSGQPYVINLWATWCPPCRRELPMLAEAAAVADVPILLVNQGERAMPVASYLKTNGIHPDPVLLDQESRLSSMAGDEVLPTTIFVDGSGQIVATHIGQISRAALFAQISEIEGDRK